MKILGYEIGRVKALVPEQTQTTKKGISTVYQPPRRQSKDIGNYLDAIRKAESAINPLRDTLYDIYTESLDYDAHLSALLNQRRLNIINRKIVYTNKSGADDKRATEIFSDPKFKQFLIDAIDTRFWGFSIFEFNKGAWFDYELIPRKHIDPIRQKIYKFSIGGEGIDYTLPALQKYLLPFGERRDLGLLKQACFLTTYKRNLLSDWSNYAELAGNNFERIKTKNDDPNIKRAIQVAMEKRGVGGILEMPQGVDVEMDNMSSTSQNLLFEGFSAYLDSQQSKLILGQTMTSDNGSSRSQAEVHENVLMRVYEADLRYILDFLNFDFIDYLELWGISTDGQFTIIDESISEPLATKLGVGGTQSLQTILTDQSLSVDQKRNIMILLFGFSETDAELLQPD